MKAEQFYKDKFHPKEITVVSKHTVIELMESYAKAKAITFAIYSDSEDCLIALDSTPDIEGEHIEEKCYRIFIKQLS